MFPKSPEYFIGRSLLYMKKEKVLAALIAVFSIISVAVLIMSIVGLNTDNDVIMLVGLVAFFVFLIPDAVVIVKYANIKGQQKEQARNEYFKEKGIEPEIIIGTKEYFFFIDKEKGVFGTDTNGELYNVADIVSYRRLFSTIEGTTKYDKMSVRIFMNGQEKALVIGPSYVRADYGSYEYNLKLANVDKIINVLDEVTNTQLNDYLKANDLSPTEQFIYDGYVFGYDVSKRIFYTRSEYGSLEKHSFDELVNYDIVRDHTTVTKLDIGDAIIGALISGLIGAAIWGKSSAEYCSELSIHIVLDGDDIDFILAQRERLPLNSNEVQAKERFIGNVVKALKTIENRQTK